MCDIDDMMLLLVQKKITNLERDVIFNLNVALRMFTKRVVILKRVEDLQLGVESYQKKLNITKLIRLDELYKFSDGTLTSVQSVLYDIASNLRIDYLPKRRWSNLDKQKSRIMTKAIDKLQLERRLKGSLEKFVSGELSGEGLRLLEQITSILQYLSIHKDDRNHSRANIKQALQLDKTYILHNIFHVSNLKKCLADANPHVSLEEIKVDKTLRFVEEPVEIMDREVKKLKRSRILIVKVRWNSKR
ncbi:hypothetical protein Tco_0943321 [Tanacetum coccineum]